MGSSCLDYTIDDTIFLVKHLMKESVESFKNKYFQSLIFELLESKNEEFDDFLFKFTIDLAVATSDNELRNIALALAETVLMVDD